MKNSKLFNDTFFVNEKKFIDDRGYLSDLFIIKKLENFKIKQVLESFNRQKGTIRGIHYQINQRQSKIVRVLNGSIYDVFVNIDKKSKNFGKYGFAYLNSKSKNSIYISNKYAHGFQTLEKNTTVQYFLDKKYSAKNSKTIFYNDEKIGINWPIKITKISKKDSIAENL